MVQFAAGRAANAGNFKPIDPARNADHTQEWPGFAPWAITEAFGRLRSGFSYLRVFEELGTPEEVADAALALCSGMFDGMNGQVVMVDGGGTPR